MLDDLIAGLHRFQAGRYPQYRQRYRRLIDEGQHPSTLFIGCADSRVVPDLLLDAEPGELFIVRNVGALIPPYEPDADYHGTAAGIEYAVLELEVTDIVVCGHTDCGAMRALYDPPDPAKPHVGRWLELGRAAVHEEWARAAGPDASEAPNAVMLRATEQRSVALQLSRLTTYPFVRDRVREGSLSLHGWHYVIEDGRVLALDLEREAFVPLAEDDEV